MLVVSPAPLGPRNPQNGIWRTCRLSDPRASARTAAGRRQHRQRDCWDHEVEQPVRAKGILGSAHTVYSPNVAHTTRLADGEVDHVHGIPGAGPDARGQPWD
jgi:hypothetical protein